MTKVADTMSESVSHKFERRFFDAEEHAMWMGSGSSGGKAQGLAALDHVLKEGFDHDRFPGITVDIPAFTVLRTDVFDAFLSQNGLEETAFSGRSDDFIAHEFQKASLPADVVGDLRALIAQAHTPLAVRSSSLLEDALFQPFAGIYATKMIPNNQPDPDERFHKLVEAIKLVYASTFSGSAKDYIKATGRSARDEKMAVIIQEVIGRRFGGRFYPQASGVARSYNFYPSGRAKPEDGVVSLALGLGKTIVDGGKCWTYSPKSPSATPPYSSIDELMEQTQSRFWAVNMGKPPAYDPIRETEYLCEPGLPDAEEDGALRNIASAYDPRSDRLSPGLAAPGPRVVNFAGLLVHKSFPLNDIVRQVLSLCHEEMKGPVEIEFATTFDPDRVGFLQVRPVVVSAEEVDIEEKEMTDDRILLASVNVLGNGVVEGITDVVYVKPDEFEARQTPAIAAELEMLNRRLLDEERPYLLIGFGRWGSSDPWLGIPVNWGGVCGARVIVEATLPKMDIELSQGSHFFHNLTSFRVSYFCVPHTGPYHIRWDLLCRQETETELRFVRHARLSSPLRVKVDGRHSRGVISFT